MKFERLGDILTIAKGKKPSFSENPNRDSIRVLQIDDLRNDNIIKYTDEKSGVLASEEDILIAWDGANAGTIGFGKSGYIGSTIAVLKKKNPKDFDTIYIGKFLQSQFDYLRNKSTGATIPHIDRKSLEDLKIPRIPIDIQIQIANILTKAENLIAQRKESIRLLDEYLKSTFLEMFGDPVRNEKGWEMVSLSRLGSLDRGVSKNRPRNAPELLGGKYPLIQTGEVSNSGLYIKTFTNTYSDLGLKQSKLWKKGTLLITIAANIAQTSILTFDACFPDSIVGFKVDVKEANTIYIHFLFGFFQKILEMNAPQSAQKNINLGILRELQVPKPTLALQNQFAQIVEKTESLKTQYQQSLQELENLYGSLSQRAFRGQLTPKEYNLPDDYAQNSGLGMAAEP